MRKNNERSLSLMHLQEIHICFEAFLIANGKIDKVTKEEINKLFCEVKHSSDYDNDALKHWKKRKIESILVKKSNSSQPQQELV
jgi:AICAR transformylase/IMP cyclohydrolase PurH